MLRGRLRDGAGEGGFLTSLFIFPAGLLRPFGGFLSDRIGARPVTYASFIVMCAALVRLSFPIGITGFTVMVVIVGVMMGVGKASVYKYIADYFPRDVGAVGGLVGAIGGLGGFVLPLMFAWAQTYGDGAKRPENTFIVLLVATLLSLAWQMLTVFRIRHEHAADVESIT